MAREARVFNIFTRALHVPIQKCADRHYFLPVFYFFLSKIPSNDEIVGPRTSLNAVNKHFLHQPWGKTYEANLEETNYLLKNTNRDNSLNSIEMGKRAIIVCDNPRKHLISQHEFSLDEKSSKSTEMIVSPRRKHVQHRARSRP